MSAAENTPPDQLGVVGDAPQCSYTNHMLDWIALADPKLLPDPSIRLYWLLKSFIIDDKGRDDAERVVQIVQEDLADMLHRSVDSIQRAMKPLYKVGLVEDKERRKISARVPGRKKPVVTTLLILQINDLEAPADYTGWRRPFEARKAVRARRAEAKAAAQEAADGSDTADLRPQSDLGNDHGGGEQLELESPPVDNSPEIDTSSVSAGQCDTADLPETGADLRQNEADLRCIGSNPAGTNPSGINPSASGGFVGTASGPNDSTKDQDPSVVTTELELVGNQQTACARLNVSVGHEPASAMDAGGLALVRPEVLAMVRDEGAGRLNLRPDSPVIAELARLIAMTDPSVSSTACHTRAFRRVAEATSGRAYSAAIAEFHRTMPGLTRSQARQVLDRRRVSVLLEEAAHAANVAAHLGAQAV